MATRPSPKRRVPHRTWHGDLLVRSVGRVRLHATRRTLGYLLAGYVLALEAVASLGGARFESGAGVAWMPRTGTLLLAAAQGLPVGYFIAFATRRRRATLAAGAAGLAVGAMLLASEALGGIAVTPLALAAAVVGAVAGSAALLAIARTARERALNEAAVIAPDLPLVGGVYVLTPLLWLAAGAVRGDGAATPWSVIVLGLYGASMLASARASRGAAGGGARGHAVLAAGWFLLGSAPLWVAAPEAGLVATLSVGGFAAAHGPLLGARGRERRMERPAVRRALPFLAIYFVLFALTPPADPAAGNGWSWAAIASVVSAGAVAQLLAAGVALGHAAAELRGRDDAPPARTWGVVGPWVTAVITLAAAARAFGGGAEPWLAALAAGAMALLAAGGARLGVSIYALQRAHARAHSGERARIRTLALGAVRARRDPRAKLLRAGDRHRHALPGIEA